MLRLFKRPHREQNEADADDQLNEMGVVHSLIMPSHDGKVTKSDVFITTCELSLSFCERRVILRPANERKAVGVTVRAEAKYLERNLFEYTDYRVFLRDYYQARKEGQPGWSLKSWATKLNLRGKSMLAMVLNGQRHPGRALTQSIVSYFEFPLEQAEYFYDLVEWQKNANREGGLSTLLLERLAKKRKTGTFELLDLDTFALISNWYFPVLRELFQVQGFQLDANWISHQLLGELTPAEVRDAIKLLYRLGILKKNATGKVELAQPHIATDSDIANEGIKRFHEQTLDRIKKSLRTVEPEEREVLSSTFVVKQRDLPKAKRMLRELANQFADSLESPNGDRVYQLQISFIPTTRARSQA